LFFSAVIVVSGRGAVRPFDMLGVVPREVEGRQAQGALTEVEGRCCRDANQDGTTERSVDAALA
jgi:hypothetical protein